MSKEDYSAWADSFSREALGESHSWMDGASQTGGAQALEQKSGRAVDEQDRGHRASDQSGDGTGSAQPSGVAVEAISNSYLNRAQAEDHAAREIIAEVHDSIGSSNHAVQFRLQELMSSYARAESGYAADTLKQTADRDSIVEKFDADYG